jgi:hypothetical protein
MTNEGKTESKRLRNLNVAFLIVNVLLVGYNTYLASQAFSINSQNMELQNKLYNFNSTMIIDSNDISMGSPNGWSSSNGIITQTTHNGDLELTIQVVTPHYGKVEIRLKSFEVSDSEYLSSEQGNETSVYFWNEDKYEYLVAQGINTIESKILLTAKVYPDPQNMPPKEAGVTFLLGQVFCEVELINLQTQESSILAEFSERVFVSLPPQ